MKAIVADLDLEHGQTSEFKIEGQDSTLCIHRGGAQDADVYLIFLNGHHSRSTTPEHADLGIQAESQREGALDVYPGES